MHDISRTTELDTVHTRAGTPLPVSIPTRTAYLKRSEQRCRSLLLFSLAQYRRLPDSSFLLQQCERIVRSHNRGMLVLTRQLDLHEEVDGPPD